MSFKCLSEGDRCLSHLSNYLKLGGLCPFIPLIQYKFSVDLAVFKQNSFSPSPLIMVHCQGWGGGA